MSHHIVHDHDHDDTEVKEGDKDCYDNVNDDDKCSDNKFKTNYKHYLRLR